MGEFFNLDNKFFQGLSKIIDCILLSVLWLLFSTPVITAGAATTALYYTVNKVIRNNRGYVWREFWGAFKTNFKQSTVVELLLLFLYAIMGVDCYIMYQFAKAGAGYGNLYIVFILMVALTTVWANYLFPYIARFENETKQVLKNCVLIAIANLPWSILLFVIFLAAVLALMWTPVAVFLVPAFYMVFANLILEKVFKKYMSPEDLAAEEERNREFYN